MEARGEGEWPAQAELPSLIRHTSQGLNLGGVITCETPVDYAYVCQFRGEGDGRS